MQGKGFELNSTSKHKFNYFYITFKIILCSRREGNTNLPVKEFLVGIQVIIYCLNFFEVLPVILRIFQLPEH